MSALTMLHTAGEAFINSLDLHMSYGWELMPHGLENSISIALLRCTLNRGKGKVDTHIKVVKLTTETVVSSISGSTAALKFSWSIACRISQILCLEWFPFSIKLCSPTYNPFPSSPTFSGEVSYTFLK